MPQVILKFEIFQIFWTVHLHLFCEESAPSFLSYRTIIGTPVKYEKILYRSKRSWMWNHFFLLEEYTGTDHQYVGKLHSDQDRGDGSVKYVLSGDGAGSLFLIDENSGDIHATKKLDREEKTFYTLRAQAVNKLTGKPVEPESEFIIKIHDINDNEPKFTKDTYVASVPEMSDVGTFVVQVTAKDADDATYGNSAKLVYSILQGQPYFSVEPETGIIRTALPNMNRENKEKYQVVIQAKDMAGQMGGLSGTTTVNITLTDVNDNPPRFPQSTYQLWTSESGETGSSIGRIKATDADLGENAEIQYNIIDGDGRDMFSIVTDKATQEGIVTLKKQLDFENKRIYTLKVEAANTRVDSRFLNFGPFKDTANVKITVQDVDEPPVFSRPSYVMDVHEDMNVGSIIGAVTAWDPDAANNQVRYSIDRHTDLDRNFNIDSGNGSISMLKSLDREASSWHNITVIATEIIATLVNVLKASTYKAAHYFSKTNSSLSNYNTASILTRKSGFSRREMATYFLPVVISDSDYPIQSSTSTLTIQVCACDSRGNMQSCNVEALILPAGLSTGALIAILLCIIILLIIVVLFAALRKQKKKEPLIISKEDVRDNIVSYNDEGGGEEDTQAFDIGTLRNPEVMDTNKLRRDIIPEMLFPCRRASPIKNNADVRDFINHRLHENDNDPTAPPYDSLATYAYEGNGSIAESLSSLESAATDCDQDYDYLSNWGPQFKKLADMYIGKDTDKDS
uniref:Cadherin-10 n=1 Tax=Erpetoichthys calabaricus TaxID=27687 RepID=A0A8C4RU91_ERPCA